MFSPCANPPFTGIIPGCCAVKGDKLCFHHMGIVGGRGAAKKKMPGTGGKNLSPGKDIIFVKTFQRERLFRN